MNLRRFFPIALAAIVYAAFAFVRWGLVAGGVATVLLLAMVLLSVANRPSPQAGYEPRIWLALTIAAFLPIAFGLLIFIITPTYFSPLSTNPIGHWLLAALLVAALSTVGFVQLGVRLLIRNHPAMGAITLAFCVVPWVATFVLVLLAPAFVILATPASQASR